MKGRKSQVSSVAAARMPGKRSVRRRVLPAMMAMQVLAGAGAAVVMTAPVQAQANAIQTFAIPAGTLASVMDALSRQTGVRLDWEPGLDLGVPSAGLTGSFTPEQALSEVLRPQGLFALPQASGWHVASAPQGLANDGQARRLQTVQVLGTAEDEIKQQLGVSTITAKQIALRPPATDLAEIIRTAPGVNLTGASSSGAYGNQRQIDIRGMGPENTLILIDGKPVRSREAAQMRRSGERDTRGDTNWVPADQVERIEIIRGPAAARYGSGAAGGVVNIITKAPADTFSGSVNAYYNIPENSDEGSARRLGFNLSGPISDTLSFRLYGDIAKTNPDAPDINQGPNLVSANAAGREGVRSKDINTMLRWEVNPDHILELDLGFSRQGNIYTKEYPVNRPEENVEFIEGLVGLEVRRVYRNTGSLTYRSDWGDIGTSRVILQYEGTRNLDCNKYSAGGPEGSCQSPLGFTGSRLKNYHANGELYTPLTLGGLDQVLTSGIEFRRETLDDPSTLFQEPPPGMTLGTESKSSTNAVAAYFEDNIQVSEDLILTPGVRFDHHSKFGSNWSPSLNVSYQLGADFTLKGGIARAYKTPNLYQSNPNYWYLTRGNGCPVGVTGPCYIQGNANLQAETSVNKEIGIQWDNQMGWDASLTYFRNDYRNKIVADMFSQPTVDAGDYRYYQWYNSGKARIQGLEGNVNVPLLGEAGQTLRLLNNFTVMIENKSLETNQPLSVVPKYTINSTLLWQPVEKLSTQLTLTWYGRQQPRTLNARGGETSGAEQQSISPYALVGVNAMYDINKRLRVGLGVSNLFDKVIERRSNGSSAGAYTYNEPGRAYYLTTTLSF